MTKKQKRIKPQHRARTSPQCENNTLLEQMEELADIAAIEEYERRKAAGEVSYRELSPSEIAEWVGK